MNMSQPRLIPLLSVVVPCYNEEDVIAETVRRLLAFADSAQALEVELIFIDDGSEDTTRSLLRRWAQQDSRIRLIGLARNFGHQIATTAGIDAARGDAVVLIDADLQDPPEVIHEMIALWRQGHDVVYGTRAERSGESAVKLLVAKTFYRLLSLMSDHPIPLDTGDFRLMSRPVVDALRAMPERDRSWPARTTRRAGTGTSTTAATRPPSPQESPRPRPPPTRTSPRPSRRPTSAARGAEQWKAIDISRYTALPHARDVVPQRAVVDWVVAADHADALARRPAGGALCDQDAAARL